MSTELEREIRAAFADVVPRESDPTLATSIRAGLKEPAPPRSRQWPVLSRWVALAVIVALVVLLIPQIGRLRDAGPSTKPGQVVGATSSASPSSEATASPAATATNQFPAHPAMFGDLAGYQFRLVSDTVGWVATGSALYRTSDDGHTWSDVPLPPGAKGSAFPMLDFVDADTVILAYGSSPLTIASTHDAGASWVQASVDFAQPDGSFGPMLTFRTALVGSATFEDLATGERLTVYHTNDGGQTWSGPIVATMPDGGSKALPVGGSSSVLSFNVGKADNKPFDDRLWLSTDGGATWPARSFPSDSTMPAGTLKDVWGTPWMGDDGTLVVPISDIDHDTLYASADNGHSWRLLKVLPFSRYGWDAQLLSATTAIIAARDGSAIWSTVDGGSTWREILGPTVANRGLGTSFISRDRGWATHSCGSRESWQTPAPDPLCDGTGLKSMLLTTSDGGHTWTPVGQ
jgi:photosystem II stability/assembly factor-like uncharacterized protein